MIQEKLLMIDFVIEKEMKSFIDLGGWWGVNGLYTTYAIEHSKIEKCFLIDTELTDAIIKDNKDFYPTLELIKGDFGKSKIIEYIPTVDAIFMFDVLLHQANPDWDEIIKIYADKTKYFLIFNPQLVGEKTLRLIELGKEKYFETVLLDSELVHEEPYISIFEKLNDIHPIHKKLYRDIHNIWQWGIIDDDIFNLMDKIGFKNIYYENYGYWGNLKDFERHAFIFEKLE